MAKYVKYVGTRIRVLWPQAAMAEVARREGEPTQRGHHRLTTACPVGSVHPDLASWLTVLTWLTKRNCCFVVVDLTTTTRGVSKRNPHLQQPPSALRTVLTYRAVCPGTYTCELGSYPNTILRHASTHDPTSQFHQTQMPHTSP